MFFFENTSHQSFYDLILGKNTYIDKTSQIATLYANHSKFEILIRPWGFGKTLLLDTISFIFEKGLEHAIVEKLNIATTEVSIPRQLVVKLDFENSRTLTAESFKNYLFSFYRSFLFEHNIPYNLSADMGSYWLTINFLRSISTISPTGRIILLIDNYDFPFFKHLAGKVNDFDQLYIELLNFYRAVYYSSDYLDWVLLCGEAKFNLSTEKHEGIPYLSDVSYSDQTTCLCGFSIKDLYKYYNDNIQDEADANNETVDSFLSTICDWYGCYRFTPHNIQVTRPYSIKSYFSQYNTTTSFNQFVPVERYADFLPVLLAKYGKVSDKMLAPNDCGYTFAESLNPYNINLFALMSQLGIYSFNSITLNKTPSFDRYKYVSRIVNREMDNCYRRLLDIAGKIPNSAIKNT